MGRKIGLFEVLGNQNRRRILEMLSESPCYLSEISEKLGIGQKAVIDHLEVLDEFDLIETYRGKYNRKYFRLAKTVHAEVLISPHATKTVVREYSETNETERREKTPQRGTSKMDREMFNRMEELAKTLLKEKKRKDAVKALKMLRKEIER